jgi:hypothetical protein
MELHLFTSKTRPPSVSTVNLELDDVSPKAALVPWLSARAMETVAKMRMVSCCKSTQTAEPPALVNGTRPLDLMARGDDPISGCAHE